MIKINTKNLQIPVILPSLTNQLVEKNAMNTNTNAKTYKPRATLPAKLRFFILQKLKIISK